MTFIYAAEDPIKVGIVYQHVIDMTGADWSLYAAADSVDPILQGCGHLWLTYQFMLPEQAQQRSAQHSKSHLVTEQCYIIDSTAMRVPVGDIYWCQSGLGQGFRLSYTSHLSLLAANTVGR
jgi:hypothetical protein